MLTSKQAWAIAHLVAELRPDWQAEGVVSALKRCQAQDPFLVALASIRAAADREARTPGVIPTQGSHWLDGVKREPERRSLNVPCPNHEGETLPCHRCANERVPADETNTALQLARAELQSAQSRLCPAHGVRETHCRGAHAATPYAQET